ncbi:MAG TPA: hypothetical protein VF796_07455 [Humisphaera sp.]
MAVRVDVAAQWGRSLRLFAGQPDPADPAHFTIAYEADGLAGVIDGWLRNRGSRDEVELSVRQGMPATPPPLIVHRPLIAPR